MSEFAAALDMLAHPLKRAELAPLAMARHAAFDWQRMAAPVVEWAVA